MAPKSMAAMTSQLKKELVLKNATQIRQITDACDFDFELKSVLLLAIENHHSAQINTSTGEFLASHGETGSSGRSTAEAQPAASENYDEPPEGILRRGQLYFKRWAPELTLRLFQFCDPGARRLSLKEHPVLRKRHLEILEFAFGVRCGEAPDKVGVDSLPVVFERMKQVYTSNGSRLGLIIDSIVDGSLSWASKGFYAIVSGSDAEGAAVVVEHRMSNMRVTLPPNIIGNDTQAIASGGILNNHSEDDAMAGVAAGLNIVLKAYFPARARNSKRHLGDGALAIVSSAAPARKAVRCTDVADCTGDESVGVGSTSSASLSTCGGGDKVGSDTPGGKAAGAVPTSTASSEPRRLHRKPPPEV